MTWKEQKDVLDWLAGDNNIEKLDISDQLSIFMALDKFTHDIKPIMEKQLRKDDEYKIDWDSFFLR